ncbi:hypothetical protein B5F40_02390 [Gordonibacter sp. An230]|uniref:hypothetical protein n=1 Tax=Gordonibacter sp. An230 TaxID=1965592 RepID=UPI000B39E0E3|nr:hypothetical protein [Gordonibacter sp. An230]OUO91707.1 hypothetical protein B5F40_02390 [Gordonibacter sp. An230]
MTKRLLVALVAFLLVGACVFAAGSLVEPSSGVSRIEADSPCPVAGCASGECHGFDDVPVPDGVHEMACPEASCSSTECHAWDALSGRYHQASDASLNVWILAPVALVVGLVLIVRKVG